MELEILSSSSVYNSAPMFFITNTQSIINLENCNLSYGSKIFLTAQGTSQWGKSGSNGGIVTLNLKNQNIEGDFIIDSISSISINLVNSQIKGTFNSDNTASKLSINIDKDSSIILTGNSYYTSITNEDSTGKNIDSGNFQFIKSDEQENTNNSSNQKNIPSNNGNQSSGSMTPPNGSGNPPSGSMAPPNGSGNPPSGSMAPPNGSGNPPSGSMAPPNGILMEVEIHLMVVWLLLMEVEIHLVVIWIFLVMKVKLKKKKMKNLFENIFQIKITYIVLYYYF